MQRFEEYHLKLTIEEQRHTNNEHEHADTDSSATAETVTNLHTTQSADQATDFENTNDNTKDSGVSHFGEDIKERIFSDNLKVRIAR